MNLSAFDPNVLLHPFALGLGLGLIFALFAGYRLFCTVGELKRYKRHLSDRLEIDADAIKAVQKERDTLRTENEKLRIKVSALNEVPDRRAQRDLEVYARAERQMMAGVPGFAGAWEKAKQDAIAELEAEEAGRSMPRRVFTRLFGGQKRDENAPSPVAIEDRPPSAGG